MGHSSIPYKRNGLSFDTARSFYLCECHEASDVSYFDPSERPPFSDLLEVEEFDNGRYVFRFAGNHFFTVQGKSSRWLSPAEGRVK